MAKKEDKGINVYHNGKVFNVKTSSIVALNKITASLRRLKYKI